MIDRMIKNMRDAIDIIIMFIVIIDLHQISYGFAIVDKQ